MIKVHRKKPTVSSGTSIFVLSADILNHFVVKDIKFFAFQSDFYAIASRKYMLRTGNDNICRYLFSFSYKI